MKAGDEARATFAGGRDIAIKVPPTDYDATVRFYREVLQLPVVTERDQSVAFEYGSNRLWIDRVDHLSQAEVWLSLTINQVAAAERHLSLAGVKRRDEIERLPAGFAGFWIQSPSAIIHLVAEAQD